MNLIKFDFKCHLMTLLTLILTQQTSATESFLCVLVHERENHYLSKYILNIFEHSKNTKIILEAMPIDLLKQCIKNGADELLLIAHSKSLENRNDLASLYFLHKLNMNEISDHVLKSKERIERELEKFGRTVRNGSVDKNNIDFPTQEALAQADKINQLVDEHNTIKNYLNYAEDVYTPIAFDTQIFKLMYNELLRQKNSGTLKLRKIRLMSCFPEKVISRYYILKQIASEFNITIDIPGKGLRDSLAELFIGMSGVKYQLNTKWFKKSYRN